MPSKQQEIPTARNAALTGVKADKRHGCLEQGHERGGEHGATAWAPILPPTRAHGELAGAEEREHRLGFAAGPEQKAPHLAEPQLF